MEARCPGTGPEAIGALAERAGLDAEGLVALTKSDTAAGIGPLSGLDEALDLSGSEMLSLTTAYVFGEEAARSRVRPALRAQDWLERAEVALGEGVKGEAPDDDASFAAALSRANGALSEAHDRIEDATPGAFADEDDYFRAKRLVAEAGQIVAGRSGAQA